MRVVTDGPWAGLDAVERMERALAENEDCGPVLPVLRRAFVIDRGPSGGPEALVYVHVEDLANGCVYGHVRSAPAGGHAAMLLHSARMVSAETPLLLFRRFDHWTRVIGDYTPVLCRAEGDAFAISRTTGEALSALVRMIVDFSLQERWPDDEDARCELEQDLRILDVLPIGDPASALIRRSAPPARLRGVRGRPCDGT